MPTLTNGRMSAVAGALMCVLLAAGCGPSSGDSNAPAGCLKFQPCGGDVVGTWKFLGGCTSQQGLADLSAQLEASCAGASITDFDIGLSGTITFSADLTYSTNAIETITVTESIPLSCTGFSTCAAVQSATANTTATCTGTTTCTCRITGSPPGNETGTYTISGTSLTMVGPDDTETDGYCVENGRLHVISLSDTTGTAIGDFVAQKQ
jgi:hypothetical protein